MLRKRLVIQRFSIISICERLTSGQVSAAEESCILIGAFDFFNFGCWLRAQSHARCGAQQLVQLVIGEVGTQLPFNVPISSFSIPL